MGRLAGFRYRDVTRRLKRLGLSLAAVPQNLEPVGPL